MSRGVTKVYKREAPKTTKQEKQKLETKDPW